MATPATDRGIGIAGGAALAAADYGGKTAGGVFKPAAYCGALYTGHVAIAAADRGRLIAGAVSEPSADRGIKAAGGVGIAAADKGFRTASGVVVPAGDGGLVADIESSHCVPLTRPARNAPFFGYHISRVPAPVVGIVPEPYVPLATSPSVPATATAPLSAVIVRPAPAPPWSYAPSSVFPPLAAVVCTDPSGNLYPPEVEWTVPATLKTVVGEVVLMPTPPDARIRNWSTAVEAKSASVWSPHTKVPA